MPLYSFYCMKCNKTGEILLPYKDLHTTVVCCVSCRRQAELVMSAPKSGDISDYARSRFPMHDEYLNKTFSSYSEKKNYLKEKGLEQIPEGCHGIKTRTKGRLYFT